MKNVLKFISDQMDQIGINYEFMEWTSDIIYPYFVGEYIEAESVNEDGMCPSTFILTGTTNGSWSDLEDSKQLIENAFSRIGGNKSISTDGSCIFAFFRDSLVVPTDTADLKRIQINLDIKEWKVIV